MADMEAEAGAAAVAGLTLRHGIAEDAETIARFNIALAAETEDKALDPDTVLAGVRGVLSRPERGFYLVAERAGTVVACLMVTVEWSDWRNGEMWWFQSVYVAPEVRRQGVFAAMYRHIEAEAKARPDVAMLRLYVERENHTAQAVYRSLGMGPTVYELFEARV